MSLQDKTDAELERLAAELRKEQEKRKWLEYGIASCRGYNISVSMRPGKIIQFKIGDCVSEVEPMYLDAFVTWYEKHKATK